METDFILWLRQQTDKDETSLRDLAQKAGVSVGLMYAVTAGDRKPSTDFCVRIAHALKLPTNDVLKRAGFPTVGDSAPGLTPHEAAMLQDYRRLSADMRVRADKIVKDLL